MIIQFCANSKQIHKMRHQFIDKHFENEIEYVVRFWRIIKFTFFDRLFDFVLRDKKIRFRNEVKIIIIQHVDEIDFDRVWKKNFDNIRVLNSKFIIVSRILFFAFLCDKSDIFDVSRDLWLRVLAQRVKRQKFDDESQMMRNVCRNSFFFNYDFFLFVQRFQIISLNLLDMQRCLFSASTSRCRHDFCSLFVSKELDLEWDFVHDTEFFIDLKTQNWIWKA